MGTDCVRMGGTVSMKPLIEYVRAIRSDLAQAARFTSGFASFCCLARDLVLFRFLEILPVGKINKRRRVRLRPDIELTYRFNKGDIYSIHEVWFVATYAFPQQLRTGLIIDLGANIGIASLWLAAQYGATKVIAVEPSASNAELIRENFTNNRIAGHIIEAAVANEDGEAVFYEVASSTNGRIEADATGKESPPDGVTSIRNVRTVSMATVLESVPPGVRIDLLKVDIEGGERSLFCGDVSWLSRVGAIVIEFHHAMIDYAALHDVLRRFGFRRIHSLCSDTIRGNTLEFFTMEKGLVPQSAETDCSLAAGKARIPSS